MERGQEEMVDVLEHQFRHQMARYLSFNVLVCINPLRSNETLSDERDQYALYYRDLSSRQELPPHVFGLAANVYFHLRRSGQDQLVVLRGHSGAGKTTSHDLIVSQLLNLSIHTKRQRKLGDQITAAKFILRQFGECRTLQHHTCSPYHCFQQLQFADNGHLKGATSYVYGLSTRRLTHAPSGERTFQVFYTMLAGLTGSEKSALHLDLPADQFHYLNFAKQSQDSEDQDGISYTHLRNALKACGIKARRVMHIFQILAAILRLGNLTFVNTYDHQSTQEGCTVKNEEELDFIAGMLGVSKTRLETALKFRLKWIRHEMCSIFLDAAAARDQLDSVVRALYTMLFGWIVISINDKLKYTSIEARPSCIGVWDSAGFQHDSTNGFEQFAFNWHAQEMTDLVHNISISQFGLGDKPSSPCASASLMLEPVLNHVSWRKLIRQQRSLCGILAHESDRYLDGQTDATAANLLASYQKHVLHHLKFEQSSERFSFGIRHYGTKVDYAIDGFLASNCETISSDFVQLFCNSANKFLVTLMQSSQLQQTIHPKDQVTPIYARASTTLFPADGYEDGESNEKGDRNTRDNAPCRSTHLDDVFIAQRHISNMLSSARLWDVIHIKPNDALEPGRFDRPKVREQVDAYQLVELAAIANQVFAVSYTQEEFLSRYRRILPENNSADNGFTDFQRLILSMNWTVDDYRLDEDVIHIKNELYRQLENDLRALEQTERMPRSDSTPLGTAHIESYLNDVARSRTCLQGKLHDPSSSMDSDDDVLGMAKVYDEASQLRDESEWAKSALESSADLIYDYAAPNRKDNVEEVPITFVRRTWVRFVWFMTWWIPSLALSTIGKMKREDVRMAWREKTTLCILILLLSFVVIFFIVGIAGVICPGTSQMYSASDVAAHSISTDYYVSLRGVVYDLTRFVQTDHGTTTYPAAKTQMADFSGTDVTIGFPIPLTLGCYGLVSDDAVQIKPNASLNVPSFIHNSGPKLQTDQRLTQLRDENWYFDILLPTLNIYKKGKIVIDMNQVKSDFSNWGRQWVVIDGQIFDLSDYFTTANSYPTNVPGVPNYHFLDDVVETLFKTYAGTDMSKQWHKSKSLMNATAQAYNWNCLKNVFYVGDVDLRYSPQCQFPNYLLLGFACIMCAVILIKFLAALQFGGKPTPEDHDQFVICQVPCYTEGEESLRKTIDSLTCLNYDDKRKLLFIICDGMVMGSGNDLPTPQIVLDILGVDPTLDPEPLMFKSIAEGSNQLNYAKVYSGLYEFEGHIVPYLVVVKVGKPSERAKPGNRGKRDSQIILMRFLNRVHFDSEMTPLELEMYHQIRNVIGVDPSFYEYILMVDADTEVYPDSLTRLVSSTLHDGKVIGICGETSLRNEDNSWTTMIQVYEYYISHHLSKAFESLFGSVTCLPGCFCMYRVRSTHKNTPLIISDEVINEYSDNHVDTLHKKNLLHLGEDRYLTTLMMKHFPQYNMTFTPHAQCKTHAPDRWSVLLSQRRRWINSTIHNLLELVFLPELCGFCCFSMRFVVLIDLMGTFMLPSTVIYIGYLIYVVASGTGPFPLISVIMLAAIYGLQAIIFIIKRQWQHIGWMLIYLCAFSLFSFFIPIYSFWHFDDFSWGNTRVVVGESNKKKIIVVDGDEERFDEKMIPLKRWNVYEQELWEMATLQSGYSRPLRHARHASSSPVGHRSESAASLYQPHSITASLPNPIFDHELASRPPSMTPSVQQAVFNHPHHLSSPIHSRSSTSTFASHTPPIGPSPDALPTDTELLHELRNILSSVNLMTVTKKQVRQQLSAFFNTDLSYRRDFINHHIEHILRQ